MKKHKLIAWTHGTIQSERYWACLFLFPSALGLFVFYLLPLAQTIRSSLFDPMGTNFVGLENYWDVLDNDAFHLAFSNTCRFLCICIPLLLLVSLMGAVLLGLVRKGNHFFKSILLLPYAIPVASIVIVWKILFSDSGLLNGILVALGHQPINFLNSSAAFWILIFTYIWRNNGYDVILWMAGLESIPPTLYDAAAVDGATAWQSFFFITLPNLRSTLVLTSILSLLNSFKVFREAYLVAGSYPDNSMYLLQHLFNNWFLSLDIGRLSAAAVLLALVLCLVIYILCRVWWKK